MKLTFVFHAIASIAFVSGATNHEVAGATNLRHRALLLDDIKCRVYRQDALLLDSNEEKNQSNNEGKNFLCIDDTDGISYTIDYSPDVFFDNKDFISGSTVLTFQKVALFRLEGTEKKSKIVMNASSIVSKENTGFVSEDVANAFGERNVLIVRVGDNDNNAPSSSGGELSIDWFSDDVNPAKQFKDCSGGLMSLNPAAGDGISNGVIEVYIDESVGGLLSSSVENMVTDKLVEKFAVHNINITNIHHIVYVLPAEVDFPDGTASYAYVNGKISVFSDSYASKLHAQMQSIGHNLGRGHSGAESKVYGDGTGFMGGGVFADEGPLMCFNAHKNWYLGWYKMTEIDPQTEPWNGRLIGVNDFVSGEVGSDSEDYFVVARFKNKDNRGYSYLGYNRKEGVNSEVSEHADMVTLYDADAGTSSRLSKLIGGYGEGDEHRIPGYAGSNDLVIKVCELINGAPDYAHVIVSIDDGTDNLKCAKDRAISPVTEPAPAPVETPVETPVEIPVAEPVSPDPIFVATVTTGNSFANRVMFDVTAKEAVEVNSMRMQVKSNVQEGSKNKFELWTRDGSMQGYETKLTSDWDVVPVNKLTGPAAGELADITFKKGPLIINKGETRAFYVVFKKQMPVKQGTNVDEVCSQDNTLVDIFEGSIAKSAKKLIKNEVYMWIGQLEVTPVSSTEQS